MSDGDIRKRRRVRRASASPPPQTQGVHQKSNVYSFGDYTGRLAPVTVKDIRVHKEKMMAKRRKKARHMRVLSAIIFTMFLVYICFYVGSLMNKDKVSETKIIMGSVETPQIFNGIIVRDEVVYKSKADGETVYCVADGDRVKSGTVICSIQNEQEVKKLQEGLTTIEDSIITMQDTRKGYSLFENDINDANSQMKKIIDNDAYKVTALNIGGVYELKEKIQQKLDIRNKLLLNEDRGSLVGLVQEKNIYENKLSGAISNITSEESGVVSYNIDGLESVLKIENLYDLTKEQTTGKPDDKKADYSKAVVSGDDVFKIVKSNEWYIVAYLPTDAIEDWKENSDKTIYIQDTEGYTPYAATVFKMTKTASNNETYVVFKFTKLLNSFLNERSVSFKIAEGIEEGLKIPNEAIADKTLLKFPKNFVFTVEATRVSGEYKAVLKKSALSTGMDTGESAANETSIISITSEDEFYTYVLQDISTLKLGDILVNPENPEDTFQISEVENVKGVYVINSGISVFKKINFEGQLVSNNSYTVINPALNSTIKNEDRIISDVRTMSPEKKIY